MKLNHNKKYVKISLNLFALYAVMVCGAREARACSTYTPSDAR